MASLKNTTSYVKFVRGTQSAWESLKAQNQIYNDTLYFIYENTGSSTGTLYLGTKQIGGGDGQSAAPVSIGELSDVILTSDLANRDILVYNGTAWVNTTVEDIINFDDRVFELDDYEGLTLLNFNKASVGQIPQVSKDGISWVAPSNLKEIEQINSNILDLQRNKTSFDDVNELILAANHLQYKKVESLESFDPEEIDNPNSYIYLVPTNNLNSSNLYDEYMFIDNKLEQVGKWEVNLSDYVTKTEFTETLENYVTTTAFNTVVGRLNTVEDTIGEHAEQINELITFKNTIGDLNDLYLSEGNETLVDQVNDLTERLTWQEIYE